MPTAPMHRVEDVDLRPLPPPQLQNRSRVYDSASFDIETNENLPDLFLNIGHSQFCVVHVICDRKKLNVLNSS